MILDIIHSIRAFDINYTIFSHTTLTILEPDSTLSEKHLYLKRTWKQFVTK